MAYSSKGLGGLVVLALIFFNCNAIPMSDVRFELNGYKNLESKAFRPTTPGNSPGIGHDSPPPSAPHANLQSKAFRPTTPGNSPGIGHNSPPPSAPHANLQSKAFRPTTPGNSPGIGHDSPPPHAN